MSPSPTQTLELLARYLARDPDAARKLFDRFRPELLRQARGHAAMRAISRHVTPEDVVQEVFERALTSQLFSSFEDTERGALGRQLAAILKITIANWQRRIGTLRRGANAVPVSYDDSEAGRDGKSGACASPVATPTAALRYQELIDRARALLGARDWEIWEAVRLYKIDVATVAQRFGLSPGAVEYVVAKAQPKLFRLFAADRGSRTGNSKPDGGDGAERSRE